VEQNGTGGRNQTVGAREERGQEIEENDMLMRKEKENKMAKALTDRTKYTWRQLGEKTDPEKETGGGRSGKAKMGTPGAISRSHT